MDVESEEMLLMRSQALGERNRIFANYDLIKNIYPASLRSSPCNYIHIEGQRL